MKTKGLWVFSFVRIKLRVIPVRRTMNNKSRQRDFTTEIITLRIWTLCRRGVLVLHKCGGKLQAVITAQKHRLIDNILNS